MIKLFSIFKTLVFTNQLIINYLLNRVYLALITCWAISYTVGAVVSVFATSRSGTRHLGTGFCVDFRGNVLACSVPTLIGFAGWTILWGPYASKVYTRMSQSFFFAPLFLDGPYIMYTGSWRLHNWTCFYHVLT